LTLPAGNDEVSIVVTAGAADVHSVFTLVDVSTNPVGETPNTSEHCCDTWALTCKRADVADANVSTAPNKAVTAMIAISLVISLCTHCWTAIYRDCRLHFDGVLQQPFNFIGNRLTYALALRDQMVGTQPSQLYG
jgi:hypothetical protein